MKLRHDSLQSIVEEFRPKLEHYENTYKDLHQYPELGEQEERTSGIASSHLKEVGYDVITNIGGHGLVGILKNGEGPTVLLRADMDALPLRERTGAPYASTVETIDTDGEKKPVMHACGHDTHISSMMAVSTLLADAKGKWKGTLIILFQPDEEHGKGARAMIDDGLYHKIPKPDIVLGQHLSPDKTGTVLIRPGVFMAAADTLNITIHGRGAHGAQPQDAIDPVLLAGSIIVRLQGIVAREIRPEDIATVTCASIHGGKAPNVIPDEVELTLNVRSFDAEVREKVISAIKRIIKGEAIASGVEKQPDIQRFAYPLTVNDEETAIKLEKAFKLHFGEERTKVAPRRTASEDFSYLATEIGVPSVFWNFGGVDAKTWERFEKEKDPTLIAMPHQANFLPVIEPTLKTAIDAMSIAALTCLKTDVEG